MFNKSIVAGLMIVVVGMWTGIVHAQERPAAPLHSIHGMVPELVCTDPPRPLQAGSGSVQVCSVVWRPGK